MKQNILAVNMPVTLSITKNLESISHAIQFAQSGDIVIFPEGAISGYSDSMNFLTKIDLVECEKGFQFLRDSAKAKNIMIWAGSAIKENEHWFNAAIGFMNDGNIKTYLKINLANVERGFFDTGKELSVFSIKPNLILGIQICRELKFPEQWGLLARLGANLIIHLNNAVGDSEIYDIWRSHLISRAAETQRFVISVNNAGSAQKCPTIIIDPHGKVLAEINSDKLEFARVEIDLTKVSNSLLTQCRTDIVSIVNH
ncbi:MAG: hypothetical protein A2504_04745 [Bdellovibrionales bacterium RIFOXYD12_FULL_39_22]|nr:MAG: hypothetical protein A2385_07080 [Bdellovibrionales bacterium RIFOXYB1_FULL_39_21]OFZ42026.1 MAG: hypothetical protein A2485_09050 [Bdellovibrionales bacterium RIFOXYC12_FULL_39_17]OFZ50742.1 MAG: hypothetical protein A2404_06000 [Bdellovibrionales bacterium RIFOXYC1_FULL_39_130]OFZ77965.1 MAG: hypothetical protein A2560_01170 [Bdellovibrionales bacterium RIFOXYD1_FULL_39_84]OFZ93599.1 MAG: hypothetical protein A2504_04745 [Bdellovibrionales bacterium RIFOXYD12_FULL_39_22]HLE10277.1 ca